MRFVVQLALVTAWALAHARDVYVALPAGAQTESLITRSNKYVARLARQIELSSVGASALNGKCRAARGR